MIVRIQGSGQFRIDEQTREALGRIDQALVQAVQTGAAAEAHTLLGQAIALVQEHGTPLAPDDLSPSDLVLPPQDATLDETRLILTSG